VFALVAASALCVAFVDRPVAAFFAAHEAWRPLFIACAVPSLLALPAAGLVLVWAVWQRLRGRPGVGRLALTASAAVLAGTSAKDELKWLLGRPWPGSWLKDGLYAWHPLSTSVLYGAYPSGHTSYIAAPLCVFWVLLPRWRWLWATVILLVMVGLVGADYHFVGDVLGGLALAMLCAWGSLVLVHGD
jgi:membrane-associated phospholipid phosphatase